MDEEDNSNTYRIDFAKTIFDQSVSMINLADTKAGIILGINGIVLALLLGTQNVIPSPTNQVFFVATVVAFLAASISCVFTIIPRLSNESTETKMYFMKIRQYSREEYLQSWNNFMTDSILHDYLLNIYNLSSIQHKKYRFLQLAIILLLVGLGLLTSTSIANVVMPPVPIEQVTTPIQSLMQ